MTRPLNTCEVTGVVWSKPRIETLASRMYRSVFNVGVDPRSPDPDSGMMVPTPMAVEVWGELADEIVDTLYPGCVVHLVGELAMGHDGATCFRASRCQLTELPPHEADENLPMADPVF